MQFFKKRKLQQELESLTEKRIDLLNREIKRIDYDAAEDRRLLMQVVNRQKQIRVRTSPRTNDNANSEFQTKLNHLGTALTVIFVVEVIIGVLLLKIIL